MKLYRRPKEYQEYWHSTKNPLKYEQWVRLNKPPEDLTRWKGARTAPTLYEKIEKDPVFAAALRTRLPIDEDGDVCRDNPTMGNR